MKTKKLSTLALIPFCLLACLSRNEIQTMPTVQTDLPAPLVASPTETRVSTGSVSDFLLIPDWASANPNVLLASFVDENFESSDVALINPETGEVFTVATAGYDAGYFWLSSNIIGLFDTSKRSVTTIHLETGAIYEYEIGLEQFDLATSGANFVTGQEVSSPDFRIIAPWLQLSPDRRYLLSRIKPDDDQAAIQDLEGNNITTLQLTRDEFQVEVGVGFPDFYSGNSWQPNSTNPYLALIGSSQELGMYWYYEVRPSFSLSLYEMETGSRVTKYDDITSVNWSPDGTRLMYQPVSRGEVSGFNVHDAAPCIFTLADGSTKCFNHVRPFHVKNDFQQLSITSVEWVPNGSFISYIYFQGNNSLWPYFQDGGLCLIELGSEKIDCPITTISQDDVCGYQVPVSYQWSPDGAFVVVGHNAYGPLSDAGCDLGVVIFNLETRDFFEFNRMDPLGNGLGLWKPIS